MNVRSSTRATSPGSDRARKLLGRRSPFRRWKVPPSTSRSVKRAHSSSEPSHHSTRSGWNTPAQCSTQSFSFWLVVIAAMVLRSGVSWSSGLSCRGGLSWRAPLGGEPPRPHVDLTPQPQAGGPPVAVEIEDHALPLAEQAEHRSLQRVRSEVDLRQVGVPHHDPVPGTRVVGLDHALHRLLAPSFAVHDWVKSPYRNGQRSAQSGPGRDEGARWGRPVSSGEGCYRRHGR